MVPQTISNNGNPASLVTHITCSSQGCATAYAPDSAPGSPGQPAVNGIQEPVTTVVFDLGTCAGKRIGTRLAVT